MKIRVALILLSALVLASCKTAPPPPGDDTLITSEVNGVTLTHRYAVQPPAEFTPINAPYRALYAASIMTQPAYSGKIVQHLENGKTYNLLGQVENQWFAIADENSEQLLGYVPQKAVVPSERYDATLRGDRPRPRKATKKVCVDVGGKSKACRNNNTATWILE
ncbi:hypothetical protein CIG19_01365 [Enterobacterales bacterium CwR94]|nr:hypothetical protein CIG19_01365 [Enterobacterales bacterium CwR94]